MVLVETARAVATVEIGRRGGRCRGVWVSLSFCACFIGICRARWLLGRVQSADCWLAVLLAVVVLLPCLSLLVCVAMFFMYLVHVLVAFLVVVVGLLGPLLAIRGISCVRINSEMC